MAQSINFLQQRIRQLNVHHRIGLSGIGGAIVFALFFPVASAGTLAISVWDAMAGIYLLLAWITMAGADVAITRMHTDKGQSNRAILLLVLGAASISVAALAFMYKSGQGLPLWQKIVHLALSLIALAFSWLLVHTRFAFHYAHRYYVGGRGSYAAQKGGLKFPGDREPDYLDFAYFSFVIGMTSQVSDVAVTSRLMRRLAMAHGLLSFGFNVAVLALSVNILASLI
ncbi:MAG TPA: DUF1345 domain-containing protein [Burkholderiales bacterium]|nr:DUF1345 domain-containing protein [Burkholderiales bacterium]